MPDMIGRTPKTIQPSHTLRTVRGVKLNEERSDEDRHLAELEERMRKGRKRREDKEPSGETKKGKGTPDTTAPKTGGHIDFTA